MATKYLNIKDAAPDDIEAFNKLKLSQKLNSKQLISALLKRFTEPQIIDGPGIDPEIHNQLRQQFEALTDSKNELQTQYQQQIKQLTAKLENQPQINGLQFIVSPSPELAQKMHRTILYLIKQKKFNRTDKDLPNQLTIKALVYLIKNEYSHIF
jgi:hypothetical protein